MINWEDEYISCMPSIELYKKFEKDPTDFRYLFELISRPDFTMDSWDYSSSPLFLSYRCSLFFYLDSDKPFSTYPNANRYSLIFYAPKDIINKLTDIIWEKHNVH